MQLLLHWNEPGSVFRERALAKIQKQIVQLAERKARPRTGKVRMSYGEAAAGVWV